MNTNKIQNAISGLDRLEKTAVLKLMIKVALADEKLKKEEFAAINDFANLCQLKVSKEFLLSVKDISYEDILSTFGG